MENKYLHQVFEEDFLIGAAVTPWLLKQRGEFIATQFNSLTAENEMKFESLQPQRGVYQFEVADKMVEFAQNNHMKMRGHTLVWHNQTPGWVFSNANGSSVSRDELLATMKEHIQNVVTRYKGKIYCWDVANEVIDDREGFFRESKWHTIIGDDFVQKAFEFAHEYDPEAQLFYNDYNAVIPEKRERICRLLKQLIASGTPIHGMGIQGHWNIYGPSEDDIKRAIECYADLGLKVQMTELDLSVYAFENKESKLLAPTKEMLTLQAERYESIFKIFKSYKDVITGITFWGVADDYTWLDNFPVRKRKNWPFLFDENYKPKESFQRVMAIK
ncbi:MAG: endo-1,4-beta-xylanase [Cellulosilyticum sp.]|nr:endo-1,4-beta-xylanase [Cellulosilyticum sp.]